jgi:hypothetical protein
MPWKNSFVQFKSELLCEFKPISIFLQGKTKGKISQHCSFYLLRITKAPGRGNPDLERLLKQSCSVIVVFENIKH